MQVDMQVDAQVAAQNSANFTNIGGVIQAFTCIDLTTARCIESSSTRIERSLCIHRPSIASPSNNRNRQCTHRLIYIAYRRMILRHATALCMSNRIACQRIATVSPLIYHFTPASVAPSSLCLTHAHLSRTLAPSLAPMHLATLRNIGQFIAAFADLVAQLVGFLPFLRFARAVAFGA